MTTYTLMVQFRLSEQRYLPPVVVRAKIRPGDRTPVVSRRIVSAAHELLRFQYPAAPPQRLEVIGISDGRRVVGEWVTAGA